MKFENTFIILWLFVSFCYSNEFKGAEYRTIETFTYGRFEVCFKSSSGAGQLSTLFTYHELGDEGSSAWNELDIEILGRYENDVQFNPITPGQENHEYHRWVDFNPSEDFHVYAIEWTPDYVAWFVDGKELHRQTGDHIDELNRDQKLMMNIWPPVYESWVGTLDPAQLPFFAYYDWVSYSSHTPGIGDVGTDNNFSFQWKDEFDSWDQDRWEKASHTFGGNRCDFLPDNVVFDDGNMILCLTDNENTGYTDKSPPYPMYARFANDMITIRFSELLDKINAEKSGNYILRNGGTIESIFLDENGRDVILSVADYDTSITHDILTINIKDESMTPIASGPKFIEVQHPPIYNYPLKINVGGEAIDGFLADNEWATMSNFGVMSGSVITTTEAIESTDLDGIYQCGQSNFVKYNIQVPNGIYNIDLLFSEIQFSEPDQRVLDINIEGTYAAENLDIFKEVGGNSAYTVTAENILIEDGIIDIHFGCIHNRALLNGIIINQISQTDFESETKIPVGFNLEQNYPNPFNPVTTINYSLEKNGLVELSIFDILGNRIDTIILEMKNSGNYSVNWNGSPFSNGIYFYRLFVDTELISSKKMILLK